MKRRLGLHPSLTLVSLTLVSLAMSGTAFAQQEQAPSGGTYIPPKISLPLPGIPLPSLPVPRTDPAPAAA